MISFSFGSGIGRGIIAIARLVAPCRSDTLPRPLLDLLEYQGKQLFAQHGVPVPDGRVAATVDDAVAAAGEIGYPCVVKAQVLIGGRGKAGGIKVADHGTSRARRPRRSSEWTSGPGEGPFKVHQVWIEGASEIEAE